VSGKSVNNGAGNGASVGNGPGGRPIVPPGAEAHWWLLVVGSL